MELLTSRSALLSLFVLVLFGTAGVGLSAVRDAAPQASEPEVKAAFLYNFARFVEWPETVLQDEAGPFTFCVVGDDAFAAVLEAAVRGKSLHGKTVAVKRFRSLGQASNCHVLYLVEPENGALVELLRQVQGPVLTVSDLERFTERGGMIQLRMDEQKVRFDVNVAATERAGLKASSQLLKLARVVR